MNNHNFFPPPLPFSRSSQSTPEAFDMPNIPTQPPSQGHATRNQLFYYETIVIRIEDQLFCIPKHCLERQSEAFEGMFSLDKTSTQEGRADHTPITLEEYKSLDFERLLKVLLPEPLAPSPPDLDKDEWISVLKLSTIWCMTKVRDLAIERLSDMELSLPEILALGKEHRVTDWLLEGLASLVEQETVDCTDDMALILGWKTVAKVFALRDHLKAKALAALMKGQISASTPEQMEEEHQAIMDSVQSDFQDELSF
ncbi:hypothetical protein BKA70DRAFT_1280030 [Coprinopsis sp. MPI-PUGE-AT-0042]|nr:hypothetical protein BKA70DRAFT_1280030 [Coprinopsis sp. MPI-PUGE-AT-0042]